MLSFRMRTSFGILTGGLLLASALLPTGIAVAEDRPLFVSVTDGQETADAGETLTYGIVLRTDAEQVQTVDVVVHLPLQANVVDPENGGVRDGDRVIWRAVAVSPRIERRLTLNIQIHPYARDGERIVTEVEAGGERAVDVTMLDSTDSRRPSLSLSVSDGKTHAEPTEELRYVIRVRNSAPFERTFDLFAELPSEVEFLGATGDFRHDARQIRWASLDVGAEAEEEVEVAVAVQRHVPDFLAIVFKASVDGRSASDTTVVRRQETAERGLTVSVSDGKEYVAPGSELQYSITLENLGESLEDANVSVLLPDGAEFSDASPGGVWNGSEVRFTDVPVSPRGERTLGVVIRVRSGVAPGQELLLRVKADGVSAVDRTVVRGGTTAERSQRRDTAVLQKTADKSEVRPGDQVNFQITLRNTTDHPFRDIIVEDRFDASAFAVLGIGRATREGDLLVWRVPSLEPGQEWSVRYRLRVLPNLPQGITLRNVVSARGEGLEEISMTETVGTLDVDVIRNLPPTGAGLDALFLGITGILGAAPIVVRKRMV